MTTIKDLIRELERTRDETVRYFSRSAADLARTYEPGKWSVRFILHHLTARRFPGANSQGTTLPEARANLREAVGGHTIPRSPRPPAASSSSGHSGRSARSGASP